MEHVLDNPIWNALVTTHSHLAGGNDLARRYPADISPLTGLKEQSEEAYRALGELLSPSEAAVFFLGAVPELPEGWEMVRNIPMEQLVCESLRPAPPVDGKIVALSPEDVPEMVALAKLTEPGPFRERTIEFGNYVGIGEGGRLLAMAGQRIAPAGYREISAVCTHPEARGRGYAQALVTAVAQAVIARGETPFLGVRSDNFGALRVYERCGFRIRQQQYVVRVKKVG